MVDGCVMRWPARLGVVLVALMVALMVAGQAAAQCVTATSLASGVVFTRADGKAGLVSRVGDGLIQIDYRAGDPERTDRRVLRLGLYPVETRYSSAPAGVIGIWSNRRVEIGYTGRFAEPQPGRSWDTNLRFLAVSDDHTGIQTTRRDRATATYRFLDPQEVTLGGCSYTMIPVEAIIALGERTEVVRTAYFPDLGYGIETQVTDLTTGAVTTNGITAMRPAS